MRLKRRKRIFTTAAPRKNGWKRSLRSVQMQHKPFLETAPYLIAIFGKNHSELADGRKVKNYYVHESVGIATGMLITAIHNAGLVSLTHTPSPMGFLNKILNVPSDEKPFLLLVTGFPAKDAEVPVIKKKPLNEIATFI